MNKLILDRLEAARLIVPHQHRIGTRVERNGLRKIRHELSIYIYRRGRDDRRRRVDWRMGAVLAVAGQHRVGGPEFLPALEIHRDLRVDFRPVVMVFLARTS